MFSEKGVIKNLITIFVYIIAAHFILFFKSGSVGGTATEDVFELGAWCHMCKILQHSSYEYIYSNISQ
jgi:hypothetical protein